MTELIPTLLAALVLGLMGAGHCLGMCGGIVAALTFAIPEHTRAAQWRLNLGYNLGRVASYSVIGVIAGALASQVPSTGFPWGRTLAGLLLIAMGLHIAGVWRGILWLERGGRYLWHWIKPVGDRFMPLDSFPKALVIGAVWGWLPCGLVYAALGYAVAQQSAVAGGLVMLAFGLGTLPALILGGVAAAKIKPFFNKGQVRAGLACAYILFGAWMVTSAWYHLLAHGDHSSAAEQTEHQHHHHH